MERGEPDRRSAEYWRGMADEARALADGLATEVNRQQMLEVAKSYDVLAEQAEREEGRAGRRPPASAARSSP
jgi:hypothetical protein